MNSKLIAPCGMNCAVCLGYLRDKNKCPGCREDEKGKSNFCVKCIIKNCKIIKENNWKYCSNECREYPCARLRSLDKRYRTKYGMSMIENLENIKKKGIRKFVEDEEKRWVKGNKIFCVHRKKYFDINLNKKN